MVGIAEASAVIGSLKAAMDIAKGIQSLKTDTEIKLATIDLMEKIISAQQDAFGAQEAQTALLQRIRALEAENAQTEKWQTEKERYQLQEFPTGTMAYVLKPDKAEGEPSHRICPTCYQEAHKSILQVLYKIRGGETVECPRCKNKLELAKSGPVEVRNVRTDYF